MSLGFADEWPLLVWTIHREMASKCSLDSPKNGLYLSLEFFEERPLLLWHSPKFVFYLSIGFTEERTLLLCRIHRRMASDFLWDSTCL